MTCICLDRFDRLAASIDARRLKVAFLDLGPRNVCHDLAWVLPIAQPHAHIFQAGGIKVQLSRSERRKALYPVGSSIAIVVIVIRD